MKRRGQSDEVQAARLAEGCCPVHGIFMPQIDGWYYPEDGANYTLVGCPRKDCEEAARAFSWDGPWERIGPHYTLIAEASTQRFRRSMRQYVAEHAGDPGVDEMAAFIAKRWPKRD